MEKLKVSLSFGEIELTNEDIKKLKPIIDTAYTQLDESVYNGLKWEKADIVKERLDKMSDDELLEVAKLDDENPLQGYTSQVLTKRILSELFKRNGIGWKQVGHLSRKQREFLESKGLKPRRRA